MKRALFIDGDILLFQIGRVTEDISDFGDSVLESYDLESAVRLINNELDNISKKTGYSKIEMVFAISSDKNFRKRFFPSYKQNRTHIRKPLGLKAMREYMLEHGEEYGTIMLEEFEADDVMGMYGTAPKELLEQEVAIYSQDKDLYTIPCKQWCFKKEKFIKPTPLESTRFLYKQVLMGDAVDGYKGCPKIGKVKAEKALKDCKDETEMLKATHLLYYKQYGDDAKEKLLEQMGQARILHYADTQLLMHYDILYNPYEMIEGVTDEMRTMWEQEYRDSKLPKRIRKKQAKQAQTDRP